MTREFETGATRDSSDNKLHYKGFISPIVLRKYAEYMYKCRLRNIPTGEAIRAPDNWKKGIPQESYADSLVRHAIEAWEQYDTSGDITDDTLCAIMFNSMGYLYEKCRKQTQQSQDALNAQPGQRLSNSQIIGAASAMMNLEK